MTENDWADFQSLHSTKICTKANNRREIRKGRNKAKSHNRADNRNRIEIFTDGSCWPNPGPGGWGIVIQTGADEIKLYGGERRTTNNQMEMQAAIEALKYFAEPCLINLWTDSQYLRKGITQWIHGWKRNGWITRSGDPVKNQDRWQILDMLCEHHQVCWHWIKGHNGHRENEIADQLSVKGRYENE